MSRVKVTINKRGYIPQLGLGPIRRPVLITKELCDNLIKLGYPVKIVEKPTVVRNIEKKDAVPAASVVEEVVTKEVEDSNEELETVVTEDAVEVQEEPAVDETVEEEVVEEEILVNDPDLSAESYYEESFLTSKALCKKILANRQVQYEDSASFSLLKKLVKNSNPEVTIGNE